MDIVELAPSIIYGAILLFLLGAVATLWARMGNIQGEVGGLKAEVAGLRTSLNERMDRLEASIIGQQAATDSKIDSLQAATDRKIDSLQTATDRKIDSLKASVDALVEGQHEMQLQAQRNHYQLMMAILSHSHRADGRVNFDLPPDFEPPSAGD